MNQRKGRWVAMLELISSRIPEEYRPKFWLIVFTFVLGLVLGVPIYTSVWGYYWGGYKLVKQEANCLTDFYQNATKMAENITRPEGYLEKTDRDFRECWSNVDPKKSTPEFIRDETIRAKHKRAT